MKKKIQRFKVKDERSNANERYHAIPQDLLFINALLYLLCEECGKGRAIAWDSEEETFYHTAHGQPCNASQIREQIALIFGKALAKNRLIGKLSQPACDYCGEQNPLKPRMLKTSKGVFCNKEHQEGSKKFGSLKEVTDPEGQ